jgi:raffinose/stachyose/melibiose transport system permease protein
MNMTSMKKRKTHMKKHWVSALLLGLYAVIVLFPLLIAVLNSFKSESAIISGLFKFNFSMIDFEAYRSSITVLRFWQGLTNNIIVMSITLFIVISASSLMAYAIAVIKTRFLRVSYILSILLLCIPINVTILQLVPLMTWSNLINTHLGASLVYASVSMPIAIFLYTSFMRTIPTAIYESAFTEGSGIIQTYFYISMPLMKTITGTVVIFSSTTIWNDLIVSMVTLTKSGKSMLVPRLYALNSATHTRWDLVFASAVLVSLPVAVLFVLLQKAFVQGLISGSLKE